MSDFIHQDTLRIT